MLKNLPLFCNTTIKGILAEKLSKLQNIVKIYVKTVLGVLVENSVPGSNVRRRALSSNHVVTTMFASMIIISFPGLSCTGEVKEIWEGDYIIYDNLKRLLHR